LTVTASANFAVGEVVEGDTSGAIGIVLAIPDAVTVTVVIATGLTKFEAEELVGPNGFTTISAVADASPAATPDWTEQMFSDIYGWPSCIEIHRSRILLGGNAAVPNAIAGSTILNVFDFDIGEGGDADGFVETIGDSQAVSVLQLHSSEQLIVLTDRGPYYVPESSQSPFRPTALAFNHFGGTWPAAPVRCKDYDGGALYISDSSVIKMSPTGQINAVWTADEKSYLCPHLIISPVDMFVVENFNGGPERYAGFVNSDGTMCVMQLSDAEEIRNFVPWTTSGNYKAACAQSGFVYTVVSRFVKGATRYFLELFAERLTMDFVTEYETGPELSDDVYDHYDAGTVHVVVSQDDVPRYYLGVHPVNFTDLPTGDYQAGWLYDREIETLPPNIEDGDGNRAGEIMRIIEANVHVLESCRFAVYGTELTPYLITEDPSAPPPQRTGPIRVKIMGRSREPTLTISQPDPLPLTVLGIGTKVSY
jgi:hypothetical protein